MHQWTKVTFLTLLVAVLFFCAFLGSDHVKRFWTAPSQKFFLPKNLLRIIHHTSDTELNAFVDLTEEFQNEADDFTESFNVIKAIQSYGSSLTLVSVDGKKENDSRDLRGVPGENISTRGSSGYSSTPHLLVPNVVHYVYIGSDLKFTFVNYLSYKSAGRFIKPDQIFVHGDHAPSGPWWIRTVTEVKNIYHVKTNYTSEAPNGETYLYPAHISDYMRAAILLRYGGIYLDPDVLVVKSFNPLRQYPFTMGLEADGRLCNGIMVATRGAPYLRLLLEQYHSYRGKNEGWAEKSVENTHKIAMLYPHLVHIEEKTLNRPSWFEKEKIYNERYDWSQNYAVHLWIRLWPDEKRPNGIEDILTNKTTIGELARRIIFGSHKVRTKLPTI